MTGHRGRRVATLAAGVALLVAAAPATAAPVPALDDAGYWAVADRSMAAMDSWWSPSARAYAPGLGPVNVRTNVNMLITHSVAALEGHQGASRNDARAIALTERLTAAPAWRGNEVARASMRSICWSGTMDGGPPGHAAVDSQVADALSFAWRARSALGMTPALALRIRDEVTACARSPHWRFPASVQNQVNWNADLLAAAALVSGDGTFLRRDYRRYVAWFADGMTKPVGHRRTGNLGTGYEFHYYPGHPATVRQNLDAPEYANIAISFLGHYEEALRAGMRPLPSRSVRLMRTWVVRLLSGSWTHAGMLNWDTGHGADRWMSAQYWAFAQRGLLAIAAAPHFRTATYAAWTKTVLDRGLLLYRRFADDVGQDLAPTRLYDVPSHKESFDCFCSRIPANAARAVFLGLGRMAAAEPPPLYAFDPDTGRLAISTPRYSTAIVPDDRGAFPYGGIEIARLFGPGARVAANVGGVPPAAFGIVARDRAGRVLLASQHVRARPLRILRSPRGPLNHPRAYAVHPYAGPFTVVEARGQASRNGVRVRSTYRFAAEHLAVRWDVRCPGGRCGSVHALLPTWGESATVDAVLRDGSTVRLAGPGAAPSAGLTLRQVARLELRGPDAGYTAVPLSGPGAATFAVVTPPAQATDPHPGPTLTILLPGNAGRSGAALALRLVPHA